MTRLGSSPPTVCTCGHSPDDHDGDNGVGWCFGLDEVGDVCECPLFERDEDR